jgi:hypothetical protein
MYHGVPAMVSAVSMGFAIPKSVRKKSSSRKRIWRLCTENYNSDHGTKDHVMGPGDCLAVPRL